METAGEAPSQYKFPTGFRFHPHDHELIIHYLRNKATSRPLPASIIAEIELYKYNPWELPKKALFGEEEWYFFSPRDRKYPNGARPNRAAGSGYWKATGTDRPIFSGTKVIGVKKSLVFYTGRPPQGIKTDWIMMEYRLLDACINPSKMKGSMRLDDWVLCRVRSKGSMSRNSQEVHERRGEESVRSLQKLEETFPTYASSSTDIFADYLNRDCRSLASLLAGQVPPMGSVPHVVFQQGNNANSIASINNNDSHRADSLMVGNNTLKRKAGEEGRCDYYDITDEERLPSDTVLDGTNNTMTYSCCQNVSEDGFYEAGSSDPMADLLELNEMSFSDPCL